MQPWGKGGDDRRCPVHGHRLLVCSWLGVGGCSSLHRGTGCQLEGRSGMRPCGYVRLTTPSPSLARLRTFQSWTRPACLRISLMSAEMLVILPLGDSSQTGALEVVQHYIPMSLRHRAECCTHSRCEWPAAAGLAVQRVHRFFSNTVEERLPHTCCS